MTGNDFQNTSKWYGDRLFHFTSSELHKLLKRSRDGKELGKVAEGYIFDKLAEELTNGTILDYTQLDTKEVRWGHRWEPVARELYETRMGVNVELCGFIEWSRMFGGSPDGLVGEDGGIEIKCPYNTAVHAQYLLLSTPEELNALKPEYYAQIQGNLLVTGRKWFDFVSYDPRVQNPKFAIKILRIPRNEEFIESIRKALDAAEGAKERIMARMVELTYIYDDDTD